jgi:hypothetical protein
VVAGGVTRPRYPWWTGAAATATAGALLALGATWRMTWVRVRERDVRLARGERCIFAFWHNRLLPLTFTHRGRGAGVLISQHRDGEPGEQVERPGTGGRETHPQPVGVHRVAAGHEGRGLLMPGDHRADLLRVL